MAFHSLHQPVYCYREIGKPSAPEVIRSALDQLHTVGAIVAPRGEGAFR